MASIKLEKVFNEYCGGNKGMDGKSFAKLSKDCKLLDSKLTTTDVDITFEKIKERTERRIDFDQFQNGLSLLAKKKGSKLTQVVSAVEKLKGPILNGTKAEPNKFHDDKSLYTGVHANGGPSTVDEDRIPDLSFLLDRSPADVRGVKLDGVGTYTGTTNRSNGAEKNLRSMPVTAPLSGSQKMHDIFKSYCKGEKTMDAAGFTKLARDYLLLDNFFTATDVNLIFVQIKDRDEQRIHYEQFLEGLAMCAETKNVDKSEVEFAITGQQMEPRDRSTNGVPTPCSDTRQLREVFREYCGAKQKTMDGRDFAKLAKDCKLLDKNLPGTEVDLVFMKVKDTQEKRISYEQFLLGLAYLAQKKGVGNPDIELTVSKSKGPILKGTRAEPNRFYDDRANYTGVHKVGGPTVVDNDRITDLKQVVDRSEPPDARSPPMQMSMRASMPTIATEPESELSPRHREPPRDSLPPRERRAREQREAEEGEERARDAGVGGRSDSLPLRESLPPRQPLRDASPPRREPRESAERPSGRERASVERSHSERSHVQPLAHVTASGERRPAAASLERLPGAVQLPPPSGEGVGRLQLVFGAFSGGGQRMESRDFTKLAKDCKLLDKKLTAQEVDLIFVKVKDKDEKHINYEQFLAGLSMMAEKKGVPLLEVEEVVSASMGPVLTGTKAEPNRFHDDRKQYTGVHKAGGPTTKDTDNITDLSVLVDRSGGGELKEEKEKAEAEARSVKIAIAADPAPPKQVQLAKEHMKEGPGSFGRNGGILRNAGMRMLGLEDLNLPRGTAVDSRELQRVFNDFAQGTHTMDKELFSALLRETRLMDAKLTPKAVDAIFVRFAQKSSDQRINYAQFLEALAAIAQEKGIHVEAVVARVEWANAPPKILMEENTERNKVPKVVVQEPKKAKKKK